MSLPAGTRLQHYEIVAAIGAGGMGEVYRARDTRLGREVAIKVLPDVFASDPERVARFEREAHVLASLNHPHVAQVHGVADHPPALIMELVSGEDLAEHIARGRIPVIDALKIARQVADALDAAHDKGIIHRDLKPSNIKVSDDGVVKVLDFGLAKAFEGASGTDAPMNSPTITSPAAMTRLGVILGTAAYMAPEQARGKATDPGADLWAFGAVLYEMLTAKPAFAGDTVTDVLAAIVTRDPDWSALPSDTPAVIARLLRRCLDRDRRLRLSDAGEARFQIDEALAAPASGITPAAALLASTSRRHIPAWVSWALLVVALLTIAWLALRPPSVEPSVARYSLELPPKTVVSAALRPAVAVSSDGRALAFVGSVAGVSRLYLRRIDAFDAIQIPGTEGASNPVFSPDGRWIAFFSGGSRLMKVPVSGGAVVRLDASSDPATQTSDPRGLSWDMDDTIVYTPQATGGVARISAHGDAAKPLTTPVANVERTHRWPQLLPGGKAVLYTVGLFDSPDNYDNARIEGLRLDTGEKRTIATGAMARYADGYLFIARAGTLLAVAFDAQSLQVTGTPTGVLQGLGADTTTGAAHFALTRSGSMVYLPAASSGASLRPVWADATGRFEPIVSMPAATYSDPRISPDGQHLALTVIAGGGRDIYIHNFQRGTLTRRTFAGQNLTPVWSPDGKFLYYAAAAPDGATGMIYRMASDGSDEPELLSTVGHRLYLTDTTTDGRLLYEGLGANTSRADIFLAAPVKGAKAEPYVSSDADDVSARVSPDGQWLAYVSFQSGVPEVFVRRADRSGGKVQVSNGGGEEPKWAPDGKRLYYRSGQLLMAAAVDTSRVFDTETPVQVLSNVYNVSVESGITYDVHPKTGRFLMIRPAEETGEAGSVRLIVNWVREVRAALARR